jgi:hypothetical protein
LSFRSFMLRVSDLGLVSCAGLGCLMRCMLGGLLVSFHLFCGFMLRMSLGFRLSRRFPLCCFFGFVLSVRVDNGTGGTASDAAAMLRRSGL